MAIITSNRPVPILEGGAGIGGTYSTEEGSRLTEKPKPVPSIKVRQPLLSEILTKVHRAKTAADKIRILKEEDCLALRQICQWSFNPKIESQLPPGIPPFKENDAPEGMEHTLLRTESNGLWHFVQTNGKSADPKLQQTVRERMFIRLLEGLHKDEAKLLCEVKEKSLHKVYKGCSTNVVKEAFGWNEDFQEYK
jgi:hypothetical protein